MSLDGRIAVVTGGGSGIGEAICHRLAADGARVAALDVRLDAARRDDRGDRRRASRCTPTSATAPPSTPRSRASSASSARSTSSSTTRARSAPPTSSASCRCSRRSAPEALAGGVQTPLDALVRLSDDEWRRLLAVHLDGTFFCTRAAARLMAPRGTGVIVNMASVCGIEGCTGHPHYSAAKAGILGFTQRGRQGADRPGDPRQRRRAGARRHEHAQGAARREPAA